MAERRPGNVAEALTLTAERFPEREFLVHDGNRYRYGEFAERVDRLANGLADLGLGPGDAVASLDYNSATLLALYFAIWKLGAVNVPLNMMLTRDDVSALVERSGARAFVHGPDFAERVDVRAAVRVLPISDDGSGRETLADAETKAEARASPELAVHEGGDRPATIIFTSGSTATPKGCVKSHANLIWSALNCQLETPRTADSVELYVVPLSGVAFSNFIVPAAMTGARVVLDRFEPRRCLELIQGEHASHAFLPGSMLDAMLRVEGHEDFDLSSLELVETAYQLSERLRAGIARRFGPIVRYCYGATEGTNWAAPADVFMSRPDCVGHPKGFDDFRVVDAMGADCEVGEVGEVVVGGATVMLGYLDDDEAVRDGWWSTGDLGERTDDGMLLFRGRMKDVIKTGGMSVAASEVELAIARHSDVAEVAVISVPDDRWGEAIVAFVAPSSAAAEAGLEDALREHCREQLAGFKRPKHYVIVSQVPKNPTGKIAKGLLRELFAASGTHS